MIHQDRNGWLPTIAPKDTRGDTSRPVYRPVKCLFPLYSVFSLFAAEASRAPGTVAFLLLQRRKSDLIDRVERTRSRLFDDGSGIYL